MDSQQEGGLRRYVVFHATIDSQGPQTSRVSLQQPQGTCCFLFTYVFPSLIQKQRGERRRVIQCLKAAIKTL